MDFKPVYYAERIKVINPQGNAGIVTCWTPTDKYQAKLAENYSGLFQPNSPLVALTSLYGNGLPQMLANLANNPQIERIAVTGTDLPAVMSGDALLKFFSEGVESVTRGGVSLAQIKGTNYSLDPQLDRRIFSPNLKVERFDTPDLEGVVNFVGQPRVGTYSEKDRVPITLAKPAFNDFPSDLFGHNIYAGTISEAWMDVMHSIDRYGKPTEIGKGSRRALFNLDVSIKDPSFESDDVLKKLNFDPAKLKAYQTSILDPSKGDQPYTYGNRLRTYFGKDLLEDMVRLFKEDRVNRHSFMTTWDNTTDTKGESSAPCLTDIYLVNVNDHLALSASFRTHNAVSAWMDNAYGLSALQGYVAKGAGIPVGPLNIRSRWIGIDPANTNTIAALELVKSNRKKRLEVNDPRGYFVVDPVDGKINVGHYSPDGTLLEEFSGPDAKSLKDQLRQINALSNADHAMWVGHQLARAEATLKGTIGDL